MNTYTIPIIGNRDVDELLSIFGFGQGYRYRLEKDEILPRGCWIRARGTSTTLYTSLVFEILVAVYFKNKLNVDIDISNLVRCARKIQSLKLFNVVCEEIEGQLDSYRTFEKSLWGTLAREEADIMHSPRIKKLAITTEKQHILMDNALENFDIERGYVDRIEDGYAVGIFQVSNGYRSREIELATLTDINCNYEGAPIANMSAKHGFARYDFLLPGYSVVEPSAEERMAELDRFMRQPVNEFP